MSYVNAIDAYVPPSGGLKHAIPPDQVAKVTAAEAAERPAREPSGHGPAVKVTLSPEAQAHRDGHRPA